MLVATCGSAALFAIPAVITNGYLVLTGSLGFIGVTLIAMVSCSPEWADFVGGRWCGLGLLPHFWCGLRPADVRGGFCGDDGRRRLPTANGNWKLDYSVTCLVFLDFTF